MAAAAVVAGPVAAVHGAGTAYAADGGRALRVMTFNLRYASDVRPHSWAERRPVMRSLLRHEAPHLLGTQEGLYGQLRDVAEDLGPHYDWVGTGRGGGSKDEFAAVFYDVRRLAPVEYDHFWLSDTPYLIGSATWGNTVVRMVTWVRFRDVRAGRELYALNTHLDHANQYSRERSARLINERLGGLDPSLPRIVMGDFNVAAHKNSVYEAMLDGGSLVDSWDTADERSRQYATFHGYRPLVPDGDRVDWILTSPGVRTRRATINTYSAHGQFPSDHLPVQALLDW
ncbi:endonuclease/exonuclease/phosphatase family protein [Streptomyces sp. Je 1-4]|uniref:endonuclease/exonuclease/phosphatase family protein n=1 Tax=unclassified Streptomyces TaxID=2593676 RepID=UPI0021DADBCB|nr:MULTISPECIES: endonuclease/exonuclease/phosphatase family protein [unclassified Streptomyces]UYB44446.1 endonuclease/exonuclease/phosphatase family protein [Streptomyces sp. Je 1-4]UZQ40902.1 endonuclease/exonuclease/phosphatase family protein [Streptomyces sp. Je 1-4] [Streptomyces sp. Je 1-4 4N24]UZQ48319.1 endonuclease/exonuclease/phosphatase family protein [Streptomyces sp. Je 1-4] [Streptomyces sp. Je 1-4 4N24_ara]